MAQRTYKIGLFLAMSTLYRYITRYNEQLQVSLEGEEVVLDCLTTIATAIATCLPILKPTNVN